MHFSDSPRRSLHEPRHPPRFKLRAAPASASAPRRRQDSSWRRWESDPKTTPPQLLNGGRRKADLGIAWDQRPRLTSGPKNRNHEKRTTEIMLHVPSATGKWS